MEPRAEFGFSDGGIDKITRRFPRGNSRRVLFSAISAGLSFTSFSILGGLGKRGLLLLIVFPVMEHERELHFDRKVIFDRR